MFKLQREVERHRDVEVSLLTTMRDVRAACQTKSEFLANMSHELRTPLNAIIGFAEIMESELVGPLGSPQYVGYAKDVRESGQYLLELINDILDLSKIEAGQLEANLEEVDLRKTVDICLRMMTDQASEAGLTIELDAIEDVPAIRSNARMLRQIILNLMSNVIKFTPNGERVDVESSFDDATGKYRAVSQGYRHRRRTGGYRARHAPVRAGGKREGRFESWHRFGLADGKVSRRIAGRRV